MKKRILIISGIVVLVLLLAGAAFVGVQLVNGQGPLANAALLLSSPGKHAVRVGDVLPAKELPQRPAEARGLFDHRKDSSFFVGTGQVNITVQGDPSGHVTTSSNHTGPIVEVVASPRTTVYRDVTDKNFNPGPDGKVQQIVEPGTLDEIGQYSMITAWGNKSGDRIIADVLVYTLPPVINGQ